MTDHLADVIPLHGDQPTATETADDDHVLDDLHEARRRVAEARARISASVRDRRWGTA